MQLMKIQLIHVLRKYKVTTQMDIFNLRRKLIVTLVSADGYNVSVEERNWYLPLLVLYFSFHLRWLKHKQDGGHFDSVYYCLRCLSPSVLIKRSSWKTKVITQFLKLCFFFFCYGIMQDDLCTNKQTLGGSSYNKIVAVAYTSTNCLRLFRKTFYIISTFTLILCYCCFFKFIFLSRWLYIQWTREVITSGFLDQFKSLFPLLCFLTSSFMM